MIKHHIQTSKAPLKNWPEYAPTKPTNGIIIAELLHLKLTPIICLMNFIYKKLEIETTKPTIIISTFKTDIKKVGLVFSISNFFIAKTSLANNWKSFSSSYLALWLVTPTRTEMAALTIQNSLQWSIQLYGKKENHGDSW